MPQKVAHAIAPHSTVPVHLLFHLQSRLHSVYDASPTTELLLKHCLAEYTLKALKASLLWLNSLLRCSSSMHLS
jgi:hypothetical protein